MSDAGAATERIGSGAGRPARAWRGLSHERRQAAVAAFALFLTLFLPWYQDTVIAKGGPSVLESKSVTLTGWGAFSFVEVAVMLIALGVLALLFWLGEGRAAPLAGRDGAAIIGAGSLASLLIVWGIVDQQGTSGHGQYVTASGIEWGIFIALAVAVLLGYFGSRIRMLDEPEPPRPQEDGAAPFWGPGPRPGPARSSSGRSPRPVAADGSPTRVSASRPAAAGASAEPSESGPATRVSRRDGTDEQLTMPLESETGTRPAPDGTPPG
jgi:hypothetical protein